ncbi:hybrid non-ribosomal peptide synthetase/type I polyketide synthase, partial [Chamaesiphon polymorphus]
MNNSDSFDPRHCLTLVELLGQRSIQQPAAVAYTFLVDAGSGQLNVTYGQLDRQARAIAAQLQQRQARGTRAVLLYPPGLDFIAAFFGCLYAGVVAVPLYPPRRNQRVNRLQGAIQNADVKFALTTTDTLTAIEQSVSLVPELIEIECITTDNIDLDRATDWQAPLLQAGDLAFLQYTSGSTAAPKGVMVSHGNLLHNSSSIYQAFGHSDRSRVVSWLPLYHDMGLIGGVLQPLYGGFPAVLMSPVDFLQKPWRWLKAISEYGATSSGGPNFAYDLCIAKITDAQRDDLDLSTWNVAFNGAEPVRAATLERFAEAFAPCGFRREAFYPCYGMAESTLFVTGGIPNVAPEICRVDSAALAQNRVQLVVDDEGENQQQLVSSGRTWQDTTVTIVDPESLEICPADRVGEIWVSAPSVAQGYWQMNEATAATFVAGIGEDREQQFLRTGDLGFLQDGELYVTGRLKDLVIIRGRNYYPQDIELTVEQSHPALKASAGAAFSIDIEGEEQLVILQEVERQYLRQLPVEAVTAAIRTAVSQQHELRVHSIVLLKPTSILKTSSGKIQRQACKQAFLADRLQAIATVEPTPAAQVATAIGTPAAPKMQFSLLYFSSDEAEFADDKYKLLLAGAKFADRHGFTAIWTPERHFHAFGGLYPNPSVVSAALALSTEQLRLRAGSVVMPLHDPLRVAEEWSVVDNLSHGRVDLAFARGWNPNDFVFAPDAYADSAQVMYRGIEEVQHLWRGGKITRPNGVGKATEVQIYPLPHQSELATWVTCTGGKERFIEAGERGLNILTALLFQPISELAEKIGLYRAARASHGHDPATGRVTLMLHTFVGEDAIAVRELVRSPFIEYIKSSVNLWQQGSQDLAQLDPAQQQKLLDYAFERYYQTSALFGTPQSCLEMVEQLQAIGVDEIACLIDFGVDSATVLSHLQSLNRLKNLVNGEPEIAPPESIAVPKVVTPSSGLPSMPVAIVPPTTPSIAIGDPQSLSTTIVKYLAIALKQSPESIAIDRNFHSLGIDSLKAVEVMTALEAHLDIPLSPTLLFEYATPLELADYLVETYGAAVTTATSAAEPVAEDLSAESDIAIIGMAGRFPQAPNLAAFWELLSRGGNAITEVPAQRWQNADWYAANPTTALQTSSRWGGFVEGIDRFDPLFFQISPREAALIDPQQRLFLEVAWEALEDAGYAAERLAQQPIGVFVGCSNNGYYRRIESSLEASDYGAGIGNQNAIIANRLSFLLNLRGPSMLVDTMCSSSLVAVHLACQSIRQGDCSGAIVGGVNLQLSPQYYAGMSRMKMHSPDGKCQTFDAAANGIVLGEGAGAILLKPLAQAVADGDRIYAVLKGSAINHDGHTNGLTAPNPRSQAELIDRALQSARLSAADISYVEAHGTGTALGDPIEIEGLTKAFRKYTAQQQFCRIGSVKTNIGHLEAAAGMAQILKVVLAMQHGQLPPSLHFDRANPLIDFAQTPFAVNTQLTDWSGVNYAGISSFGIGGTNAHVILGTPPAPVPKPAAVERPVHLLTLSAKSQAALSESIDRYLPVLAGSQSIGDLCFTANSGRNQFAHRLSVWGATGAELAASLQSYRQHAVVPALQTGRVTAPKPPSIVYLCTGQGCQYANMGRTLYDTQPTFRQALQECDRLLQAELGQSLIEAIYPAPDRPTLLDRVLYSQTAIFAIEYALAQLWLSWGIQPNILLGHSLGEYVAACLAGVFSLEDALLLVARRARYAQELTPTGEMVAVFASSTMIANIAPLADLQVSIAAYNSRENTVLSGSVADLTAVCETLAAAGIRTQKLASNRAFHSPLLMPMVAEFRNLAAQITYHPPQIPLISNVTGQLVNKIDAEYWVQHLLQPVQFTRCLDTLQQHQPQIYLEIGPKPTLISLGKQNISNPDLTWLPSLRSGVADWEQILTSLGSLWVQGVAVNWEGFDRDYSRQRISLPTYPFQRQRYWLGGEPTPVGAQTHQPQVDFVNPVSAQRQIDSMTTVPTAIDRTVQIPSDRQTTLLTNLHQMTAQLLKANVTEIDVQTPFLEIGADSLMLVEAVNYVEITYGVKITLRQLFEEVSTIAALATYLDRELPPDPQPLSEPEQIASVDNPAIERHEVALNGNNLGSQEVSPVPAVASSSEQTVSTVLQQQIASISALFAQQLALLGQHSSPTNAIVPPPLQSSAPDRSAKPNLPVMKAVVDRSVPFNPPATANASAPQVPAESIAAYNQQTAKSKHRAQADRAVLADSRATAGFRPSTKELVYPIIGDRAEGSRFWDIDGNEYIDLTMGFGVLLFGHNPDFVAAAIAAQTQRGLQIGPQSDRAGAVAQLISELTGVERVAFCNSGTEAVMTAVRLARTATGRSKIALFAGSYHGHFDGILAKAGADKQGTPIAPGIPAGTVADTIVLNYDDPAGSLAILQAHAAELAAILVEPVQARRPDLQPIEFLQQLRQFATSAGIALIFDEVLLGFRIQAGGAQAWAGVRADIVTYGKIVGGGLPIGVVAGLATYLDGIDGGWWQYGDNSYPGAEKTFFAGTFNKNHVGMAAAVAVLEYLKQAGSALYDRLNQRTASLTQRLNAYFAEQAVPIRVVHFGSLFRFTYTGNFDLFFQHLLLNGVYVWEGRNCFLSTAHTDEDLERVVQAVRAAVQGMRGSGLLPGGTPATVPALPVASQSIASRNDLPLSLAQQRLWFLDRLEPNSAFYNMPAAVRLRGRVQIAALEQTLQTIIDRHEVLRTNFGSDEGQPVQTIHPQIDWQMTVIPIASNPDPAAIQHQIAAAAQQPFRLDSDPPIRATLWEVSPTESILLLVLHHIIADGLSMAVLVEEIAAIYPALCLGYAHQLPPVPMQYADFAKWQRQWLQGEVLQTQLDFWKQQLAGVPTILELPTDRPRPPLQTVRGAHYQLRLSAELTTQLGTLGKKMGVTLFMVLLAAFDVLLYRYTRQTDILVGSPIASRQLPETQKAIGLFLNILLLRVDLAGNPSFEQLLRQVRQVTLDAYTHPDVPFEQLIETLRPERDLSHPPLFQVMMILDRATPIESQPLPDLVLETIPVENFTSKLDLTLTLENQPTGLVSEWEYNTDLFDRDTIVRLAAQFEILLGAIVSDPSQSIDRLPLLSPSTQQQLLAQAQGAAHRHPDLCLHQAIEAQVALTPEAVAVVWNDERFTYQELNERANQLAHYLQAQGVAGRVGIYLERSGHTLVAVLAVLKIGAAYVPLDPSYPVDRLAYMLTNGRVNCLLTDTTIVTPLPNAPDLVVYLDRDRAAIASYANTNLALEIDPSSLAYVIYTSGSTGMPKGVTVSHRSLVNAYHGWESAYQLRTRTRSHLQMASFSFDVFAGDYIRALASGAKLEICPRDWLLEPARLDRFIRDRQIDCAEFVPAVMRLLAEYLISTNQNLAQMSLVVVGSDRWYVREYQQWQQLCGSHTRLINSYGVSEATIDSCYFETNTIENFPHEALVPVGKPFPNVRLYVLEPTLQPAPLGVPGELYIGGMGVSPGYDARPDLTEIQFIADPFSDRPDAKLYRTGDLARYLADGNLEYLGRIDQQVKIRGLRIELAEIESVLQAQPSIQQAIVLVREDQPGQQQLVAYLVTPPEVTVTANDVRRALREKLPEYMIPNAWIFLAEFPLTPNGKVDRRALPAPTGSSDPTFIYVAPRNPTEEVLAQIWVELLPVDRVGIRDNFFNLGGHSLLATQLISRIRSTWQVELPLRLLFEATTIEELAIAIQAQQSQDTTPLPIAPPIQAAPVGAQLPLSFAQQRLWFLDRLEPDSPLYNIPVTVRLQGTLQIDLLERSLQEVIQRHAALRTDFVSVDGAATQVIHDRRDWQLTIVDLGSQPPADRLLACQELAHQEAIRPFQLDRSPLLRATLVCCGVDDYLLLLTVHHIVADAWSMGVLVQEVATIYSAAVRQQPADLPDLPIQYSDFALWQRSWLQGEVLAAQLAYWQTQLAGAKPLLELPLDRARPAVQSFRGAHAHFSLERELTAPIERLSRDAGVTPFMTLLAAFYTLLYRYTGQTDLLVGSPIANRNRAEIEGLIGFFVNTLVLRTDLAGDISFRELLGCLLYTS